VSLNGTRILISSLHAMGVWDARTFAQVGPLRQLGGVGTMAMTPDGHRIVTGSYDNTAQVWDAETFAKLGELRGHSDTKLRASGVPGTSCYSRSLAVVVESRA
jgi:WD40 repeat protein